MRVDLHINITISLKRGRNASLKDINPGQPWAVREKYWPTYVKGHKFCKALKGVISCYEPGVTRK